MNIKLPSNLNAQPGKTYLIDEYQLTPSSIDIIAKEIHIDAFPEDASGIITAAMDPEGVIFLASNILDGIACHRPTFVSFFTGVHGVHYKLV